MSIGAAPQLIFIVGVDGTGKTTLINNLVEAIPDSIGLEATSTPEVKAFKKKYSREVIDSDFIDERESLFLGTSEALDAQYHNHLMAGKSVITTGAALITRISHTVMREVVSCADELSEGDLRDAINKVPGLMPDVLICLHAPMSIIQARIQERIVNGDLNERPWGFNSLFFLRRYQEAWHTVEPLMRAMGVAAISVDTSANNQEETLNLALRHCTEAKP